MQRYNVSDDGYESVDIDGEYYKVEEVQDLLYNALVSDLENGVAFLNRAAFNSFQKKYPELSKALSTLL